MAGLINTLRPKQNGRRFADDVFKCIFLNVNVWISLKISLKCVPKVPINNIPALLQILAWRRSGDKPLSEPMMVSLLTHICVTRPQWVKKPLLTVGRNWSLRSKQRCVSTVKAWTTSLSAWAKSRWRLRTSPGSPELLPVHIHAPALIKKASLLKLEEISLRHAKPLIGTKAGEGMNLISITFERSSV